MTFFGVYDNCICDENDCKNKTCYGIGGGPYGSGDVIAYCWEHLSEKMRKKHVKQGQFPKEAIPWINNYLEQLDTKIIEIQDLKEKIKSYSDCFIKITS